MAADLKFIYQLLTAPRLRVIGGQYRALIFQAGRAGCAIPVVAGVESKQGFTAAVCRARPWPPLSVQLQTLASLVSKCVDETAYFSLLTRDNSIYLK